MERWLGSLVVIPEQPRDLSPLHCTGAESARTKAAHAEAESLERCSQDDSAR